MNPSQTPARTPTFFIFLARAKPVATTSGAVLSATTTSKRRMRFAGEKKWRPITSSGRDVAEAISLMSR